MKNYDATEQSYKNGYKKGYEDGKKDAVKHGRWVTWQELFPKRFSLLILKKKKGFCSYCGAFRHKDNYCPNCGADMRGEEDA